jgi:tRNA threonylcarbamoyladenosine biosynthesis protein TsaE
MKNIFEEFLTKLRLIKNNNRATVIFLWGNLGSGKTTFTKNLCKYLDIKADITSPTFNIIKKYPFDLEGFKYLIHIDAYRLNSYEDLLKIKFEEYLNDKNNLMFIEWPSVIEDGGLKPDMDMKFDYIENIDDRIIEIK